MNSFLAKCLGITAIIIALSVAYYVVAYLPQKNQTYNQQQARIQSENDLSNKQKCIAAGETLYKQDVQNAANDNAILTQMLDDHEYAYNSNLNTCLYKGGYTQIIPNSNAKFGHDLIYTWWVKDSLTNKDILDISYNIDEIDCSIYKCTKNRDAEVDAFMQQANALMQNK
jgi:hypothetical protein